MHTNLPPRRDQEGETPDARMFESMRLRLSCRLTVLAGLAALLGPAPSLAGPGSTHLPVPRPLVLVQASSIEPGQNARDLEAAIEEIRTKLRQARQARPADGERERLAADAAAAAEQVATLTRRLDMLEAELGKSRHALADAHADLKTAESARADLAGKLEATEQERDQLAAAAERREREIQAVLAERDRALQADQVQRRSLEEDVDKARRTASEKEAAAASEVAAMQARLTTAEQDLARAKQALAELEGGQGKAKEKQRQAESQSTELKQQLDQLVAERDKARTEAAAAGAAMEARLADAERQLEAMGDEVRQAWADRAAAERRIDEVTAGAEAARSELERLRNVERTSAQEQIMALRDELGVSRSRAAALDSMAESIGSYAQATSTELERMRKVASTAVAEATDLGHQLVAALGEVKTLSQLVARIDLAQMMSSASLQPAGGDPAVQEDAFSRLKGDVWPVLASASTPASEDAAPAPASPSGSDPFPSRTVLQRLSGLKLEAAGDGWLKAVADGIEFEQGGDRIGERSERGLVRVATLLQLTRDAPVRIVGHTDSQGDAAKNLDLSKRRASALRDALVERFEIDPARITVEGMGSQEPVASNRTARGRSANRRVEVLVAR